jgi:hypothetical protein
VFHDIKRANQRLWSHQKTFLLHNANTRAALLAYHDQKDDMIESFMYRYFCTDQHSGLLFLVYMLNHDSVIKPPNNHHLDIISLWINQYEKKHNNQPTVTLSPRRVPFELMSRVFDTIKEMAKDPYDDALLHFPSSPVWPTDTDVKQSDENKQQALPLRFMNGNYKYTHTCAFSPIMYRLVDELIANVLLPLNMQSANLPVLVIVYYVGCVILSSWQNPQLWQEWTAFWSLVTHPIYFSVNNQDCRFIVARLAMHDRVSNPKWVMQQGLDLIRIFTRHSADIGCITSTITNYKTHNPKSKYQSGRLRVSCTPWAKQRRNDVMDNKM